MARWRLLAVLCFVLLPWPALAAEAEGPDGPHATFRDDLLDRMVGAWTATGQLLGRPAKQTIDARWVLNHQWLLIHQRQLDAGKGEVPYEALVYVGYDHMSERYVAHWIDVFGGRASETLGYGTRSGNALTFVFEYPDAPFRTTFTWRPETKGWQLLLRTKNKKNAWLTFADFRLARASGAAAPGGPAKK